MENISLKQKYETEMRQALLKDLGYKNALQVPKIEKVVLNVGVGRDSTDQKVLDLVRESLKKISGQNPATRKAKKAIAGFKLREGQPVGMMVTLRGTRMYDFLQKLNAVVFPRMRDFRGLSTDNFDKNGNFSLGFSEQIVFPEIDLGSMTKTHGIEITIVTTAKTKEEAQKLLTLIGFKFKDGKGN